MISHENKKRMGFPLGPLPGNERNDRMARMKRTILLFAIAAAQLAGAAACATAAADVPSGGKTRFRKVFAFTDIGDDEHAAKLAELNVFAANCCDAGNRPDPEKIERAKRFGIVPYVAFGPFCGSHVQALSPEDLDRELRAVLESGAEYLAVHEIDSVVADPAVFAVFRKYCASPDRTDDR